MCMCPEIISVAGWMKHKIQMWFLGFTIHTNHLGSTGFAFTITCTITRTLALVFAFMMDDVRADAAHAHGHVTTVQLLQLYQSISTVQLLQLNPNISTMQLVKLNPSISIMQLLQLNPRISTVQWGLPRRFNRGMRRNSSFLCLLPALWSLSTEWTTQSSTQRLENYVSA